MRFLNSLGEEDRFRVAHPRQTSLNKRPMPRDQVFRVKKVYLMTPNVTISVREEDPKDGFYSLGPRTPVLSPGEPNPTEEAVMRFLGVKTRKKVVGYRVLWDGKTDLSRIIPPQAIAAMKLVHAIGQSEYRVRDIHDIFRTHYEKFWGRPIKGDAAIVFFFYRRHLVNHGLLEEIVDSSRIPNAVREANLQEEFN